MPVVHEISVDAPLSSQSFQRVSPRHVVPPLPLSGSLGPTANVANCHAQLATPIVRQLRSLLETLPRHVQERAESKRCAGCLKWRPAATDSDHGSGTTALPWSDSGTSQAEASPIAAWPQRAEGPLTESPWGAQRREAGRASEESAFINHVWHEDVEPLQLSDEHPLRWERQWGPIRHQVRSLLTRMQRQSGALGPMASTPPPAHAVADLSARPRGGGGEVPGGGAAQERVQQQVWTAPLADTEPEVQHDCGPDQGARALHQGLSLRDALKRLSVLDPSRILVVRKVRRLGADAAELLREHFAARCAVDAVLMYLVRKGGNFERARAGELAFVITASAAGAQSILDTSPTACVAGHLLEVVPFDGGPPGRPRSP